MGLNRYRPRRNWGARILESEVEGMKAVSIESQKLRVSVLAGRGADVYEFNYKPRDMDFVWLTASGIRNAADHLSTSPDPIATFMDYYLGGWQEILPNGGAPSSYLGAQFGQHGEVSQLPWDYAIEQDSEDSVAVRFEIRCQKTPFYLRRVLRLGSDEGAVDGAETLVNESDVPVHAMWGHHITFGRPFLEPGCHLRLPRGVTVIPHDEAIHPEARRVRGGQIYQWPNAERQSGGLVDLSEIPGEGEISEMLYLTAFPEGWYEVINPKQGLGFRLEWDAEVMPYLWFWQEFGATAGYPWYGRHYNVGLEPFSSYPTNGIAEAVRNGTAMLLEPRASREFSLRAVVLEQ